jgi:hypothetical protein
MEDTLSNVSYLNQGDHSIFLGNRLHVKRTNLMSLFEETEEHSVSKSEKVKVYLRIKPTKDDKTQMLAPPQASEICVLCVMVYLKFSDF